MSESKKVRRLMIDIETLSTLPTAKIVEIGVCEVPENPVATIDLMHRLAKNRFPIAPSSYEFNNPNSFHEDRDTVGWWRADADRVKHLDWLDKNGMSLQSALGYLTQFITAFKPDELWCKGASFDLACLRYAYAVIGQKTPWHYRAERCQRVITGMLTAQELELRADWRVVVQRNLQLQQHVALDDAIMQAYELSWTIDALDTLTSN